MIELLMGAAILWQDVEVGMTFEQVAALYPEKVEKKRNAYHYGRTLIAVNQYIKVSEDCWLKPSIDFQGGVVKEVILDSHVSACTSLKGLLMERYGPPVSEDARIYSDYYRINTERVVVWFADGVIITLVGEGEFTPKIIYAPAGDPARL